MKDLVRFRSLVILVMLASGLLFSACSLPGTTASSSGAVPDDTNNVTSTPTLQPTPTLSPGAYAFARNNRLWIRRNAGSAYPLTSLSFGRNTSWGQFAWSPDGKRLAFVVRDPSLLPATAPRSTLAIGQLGIVNIDSGYATLFNAPVIFVPLDGRHLAWLNATTLLATQNGAIVQFSFTGATTATIAPLVGPRAVWEMVVRNGSLYYSTLAQTKTDGTGTGELHRFMLTGASDTLLATLGPSRFPPSICDGLLCPPDTNFPLVPYAWDVAHNGQNAIIEQAVNLNGNQTATPVPPNTPISTPAATAILTPAPSVTHFLAIVTTGSQTGTSLFSSAGQYPGNWALAYAPDDSAILLDLKTADSNATQGGPFAWLVKEKREITIAPQPLPSSTARTVLSGYPAWAPDNGSFTLTLSTAVTPPSVALITYRLDGRATLTEIDGSNGFWAIP